MRLRPALLLLLVGLGWGGCASRPLPKFEPPLARAAVQRVRTTAYTHTESDHQRYGARSAAGTLLQYGEVHSAAADWSRWPNGTLFRIQETGEVCQVDDYGWALSGTNTIDLYKPSRSAMNAWGTHYVHIELLRWGDVWSSQRVLEPRARHAHIKRMLREIAGRYRRGRPPAEPTVMLAAAPPPVSPPVSAPVPLAAEPAARPLQPFRP